MLYKRCTHPDKTKCRCAFWYEFVLHERRYRKSTRTANRQTAGRIEERRRVAILENRDEEDTPTIFLDQHIDDYKAHTAKKNRTAYKDAGVLSGLLGVVGPVDLRDVSPFHLEKWKTHRATEVSRSTVNRELNIVRGCFSRAVEWERLGVSPCDKVKAYKVDDRRVRILSDTELRAVLGADPTVVLICRVTLECLPRLSEVLAIHKSHIGPSWVEMRRKGGKVERIAIASELRDALLGRVHTHSGYVFGEGEKGIPPTMQAAGRRIVKELKRLKITGASHHTMRHTGVTLMLEAGVNPRVIQKLAGWTSLRMLERYGHARDTEMQRAVTSNAAYLSALPATAEKEKQA